MKDSIWAQNFTEDKKTEISFYGAEKRQKKLGWFKAKRLFLSFQKKLKVAAKTGKRDALRM